MKKLFILAFCVSLGTAAFAQDSTRAQHAREHRMPDLQLSSDQKEQLKTINKDFFTASHNLRSDSTLSKADRKTKFEALDADRQSKIKGVLSADQYAQWQQAQSARKEHMRLGGPGGKGGPGRDGGHRPDFAKMQAKTKADLGLTDAQSQQLADANKDFFKSMGDLRKSGISSDSTARRSQFQSLRTAYDTKVKGILSADQYAKWQQEHKDMREHMRPGGPGGPGFGHMGEKMKADLGLSDDQSTQLSAATQDFFKNARNLRSTADSSNRRTQFQALKTQYDSKVQAILTPDQFSKWQQHQKDMRQHFGHGRPHPQGGDDQQQ